MPIGILIFGFLLRTAPLTQNRFHPDEALYATFARLIASGRDPLLSSIVVDKPPLPFYLMAASMSVFGGTEFAARLPTLFASILTVALTYRLTRTLYSQETATLAAILLAASPLAILFAITLFTDTLLGMFLTACLLLVAHRRWAAAGWMFGLAFASKQTALFFIPLVLAMGILAFIHRGERKERRDLFKNSANPVLSAVIFFAIPVVICTALIFIWDFSRQASISFWTQGYSDNTPGRLVRSNEIWLRWWAWVDLWQYLIGSRIVAAIALLCLPAILFLNRRSLPAIYDFTLTAFITAFVIGYWLLAFNVWDRYLVILTPVVAILAGRVFERIVVGAQHVFRPRRIPQLLFGISYGLLVILLLPAALVAAQSGFPIGGDHGAYDGIDQIAETVRDVPPGSVLYDHWLSWELGFYLFDGPAYVAWMPGPGALADDLRAFGNQTPRYIVSPSWESFAETRAAIESVGFEAVPIKEMYRRDGGLSFTLYQIKPR